MSQINRRAVVRGAAWTVPVVAVASTAPAFAASTDAPRPSNVEGCRITWDSNTNCYRFYLTFPPSAYAWKISLTSVFLTNTSTPNGVEVKNSTVPQTFTVPASSRPFRVELKVCTTGNLQTDVDVKFSYDATMEGNPNMVQQVVVGYSIATGVCDRKA